MVYVGGRGTRQINFQQMLHLDPLNNDRTSLYRGRSSEVFIPDEIQ